MTPTSKLVPPTTLEEALAQIALLTELLGVALARIAELEEKLRTNSSNSSKPPSSDPPWAGTANGRLREPGGRHRGAQPGHKPHRQQLLPQDQVDKLYVCRPPEGCPCGGVVEPIPGDVQRRQVLDIPEPRAHVTEIALHAGRCTSCGLVHRGIEPKGAPPGLLGPRASAVASALLVTQKVSRRDVQSILKDGHGIRASLGALSNGEKRTSNAVAEPVADVVAIAGAQPETNMDETGFGKTGGIRQWLWVAISSVATIFLVRGTRGADVVKEILGTDYTGTVVSDRWVGYAHLVATLRQLCWAHLLRDFVKIAERAEPAGTLGRELIAYGRAVFHEWHEFKDGKIDRATLQQRVSPLRAAILETLAAGAACEHQKTAKTCKNLVNASDALFTFIDRERIEPTNNAAERELRGGVMWRKRTHGADSERGCRFAERLLTVAATCRQYGVNVIDYLTDAIDASFRGAEAPPLIPTTVVMQE